MEITITYWWYLPMMLLCFISFEIIWLSIKKVLKNFNFYKNTTTEEMVEYCITEIKFWVKFIILLAYLAWVW